jgi:hypothetical protein
MPGPKTPVIAQAVAFGQRVPGVPARSRYGLETSWVMAQFLAWRPRLVRPAIFRP